MTEDPRKHRTELIKEEYEKRKESEKKAHNVVLQLLDGDITEEFFSTSLQFLTPQHYEDVVDERSIGGLCGYCLCQNEIVTTPQQKYRIVKNKVFDITERKKFCSGTCFAKSQRILPQISSTPLWTRDHAELPHIQIPDDSITGHTQGVEVQLGHVVLPTDDGNVVDDKSDGRGDKQHLQSPIKLKSSMGATAPERLKKASDNHLDSGAHRDLMSPVLSILKQWLTRNSLEYLAIDVTDRTKGEIVVQVSEDDIQKQKDALPSGHEHDKSVPNAKSSLRNYEKLNTQLDYENKVKSFMGNVEERTDTSKPQNSDKKSVDITISLPTVDSRHQLQIRQKIVKDRIVKLANEFSLDPKLIRECQHLIDTFLLTSKNVMLPSDMWPLVTISLLLLISQKSQKFKDTVMLKKMLMLAVLKPYGLDIDKLEKNLMVLLTKL